ncbi:hypothetical protein [Nocardia sp. NBC_00416]|uniref:hypothetical protein n=1 Tax=Nocardia sp. NBC_00416 TaxID=2975991 RepID=UPI002E1EE4FA
MTASHLVDTRVAVHGGAAVDIAGSRWPVYKLEALVAGLLIFLVPTLVLGSAQVGVLLGAAVGTALWALGWWRTVH